MDRVRIKPANILIEKHMDELRLEWRREYQFHPDRKWKFDYIAGDFFNGWWQNRRLAIEIEGSVYAQGRHTRGKGFEADCEKYNTATMMGYRVLRFSTGQVLRGEAKKFLAEWMGK